MIYVLSFVSDENMIDRLPLLKCIDIISIMREVNLRSVDVNLLVVLDGLLDQSHVTLAAQKLGMSQPAMSRALGRLRVLLRDPLLVRGADGLMPTARARALQPQLKTILAGVRNLVASDTFDPRVVQGMFTIAATDHQTILLLPQLMAMLSREAPNLDVRIVPLRDDTTRNVAAGRIDIALGIEETVLPPSFHRDRLFADRFVTLLRRGHPAVKDWTLERYLGLNHVLVTINDDGGSAIDKVLDRDKLKRRIALRLPHFVAAMNIVSLSDLVITVPQSIARHFASQFKLEILETPVKRAPFTVVSYWAEVSHADEAHIFVRQKIRQAAKKVAVVKQLG
jgi:DNA-binding transcriptional LysR family regulator